MKVIWIGDQRSKQLQFWQEQDTKQQTEAVDGEEVEKPEREYEYIIDNNADVSWFKAFALYKVTELFDIDTVLLVNIGLNDCMNSCIWSNFSVLDAARDYVDEINALMAQSSSLGIYVCTVAPVNANIPRSEMPSGYISMQVLNEKIDEFNTYLKGNCRATIIDCCQYLTNTSFATRDGLLFTASTCLHVSNYILNSIKITYTKFPARLNAPPLDNSSEENKFWTWTSHGGLNIFILEDNKNVPYTGCALPNCTAYAWGRFYEILGEKPKLYTKNAETWFGAGCSLSLTPEEQAIKGTAYDGYTRGFIPKEGAVACWEGHGDRAGHVAIVEQVLSDSKIVISESGWQAYVWRLTECSNEKGNWGRDPDLYKFLGFIYCPAVTAMGPTVNVKKEDVVSRDKSISTSEMEINAMYIWNYLGGHKEEPWTLNAVAGILGNMEYESSINPGRHETAGSGFGLVQWTPKKKFTEWLATSEFSSLPEDDIDGQLERIIWEKNNGKQYGQNYYKYTFKEFAVSTDSAYELACAFAFDYERPAVVGSGFHTKYLEKKRNYCKKTDYDSKCETDCKACKPCYQAKFGAARTAQQKEVNRDKLRKARGEAAERWFKFLLPYAPGTYFEDKFIVTNLKVDSYTETSCTASLLVGHAKSAIAHIYDAAGKEIDNKPLTVTTESEEELFAIVSFDFTDLTPGKYYSITVEVESDLAEAECVSQTVEFTTLQSRPACVTVNLKAKDCTSDGRLNEFQASWTELQSTDWGYWAANDHGIDLDFYINGQKVLSDSVNPEYTYIEFIPKKVLPNLKLDDSLQVGLNPWTTDDDGERIYASEFGCISSSVQFLKQAIRTYLNLKEIS